MELIKNIMKFSIETNNRTFNVVTKPDKNATSNYNTFLSVYENKVLCAGCTIKNSTPKKEVEVAAKKCIKMYLLTNFFN